MDTKTDQMIALVLQINGFVKADDLQSLSPDQRGSALRSYYQDHVGDTALHWRGEQLWEGAESPDNSFFADAPVPTFETPPATEPFPAAAGQPTSVGPYGMPDAGGPDVYGDLTPAPDAAPAAVAVLDPVTSPFAVDATSPAAPAMGTPLSAEPIVAEVPVYNPPVDSRLEADFLPEPAGSQGSFMNAEEPVNPWWWVLAILWAPLGGIVAYLVVKGTNRAGAGRLLKVSLLVWVATFVLGIALAILVPLLLT